MNSRLSLFGPTEKATFLNRPNRFTLFCRLKGKTVRAFLPNPGRLWEMLLPGATVYLERAQPGNFLSYTVVAVQKGHHPVMIHTHRTNDLVEHLLRRGWIPALAGAEVLKREVSRGRSRFDFHLRRSGEEILLEVKSCTLFGRKVAMFPDAVTARGKRHVEELASLAEEGKSGAVLFLICWPKADIFMPEYHTDWAFSRTLLAAKDKISIIPLAVGIGEDFSLNPPVRTLKIPWDLVRREAEDRGSYILVLHVSSSRSVEVGRLGRIQFPAGYYLYVGSAEKNLTRRLERHRRERKRFFWHIDYLRARAEVHQILPIRTSDRLECELASALKKVADWEVPGFGSSDCGCLSHLFGMRTDPLHSTEFIDVLQYFRMDRLFERERRSPSGRRQ
jgi:sugar fermentation stimulation protein A